VSTAEASGGFSRARDDRITFDRYGHL